MFDIPIYLQAYLSTISSKYLMKTFLLNSDAIINSITRNRSMIVDLLRTNKLR